jgi:DNA repair protein RAD16
LTIRQSSVSPSKNKGKEKATVIDSTPAVSGAEDASDLGYDEDEPIDESDDSGSEFKVDSDADDEEIMVDAAIRSSLQTASERIAGPLSRKAGGPSAASMLRAVAAERRLARMNAEVEFEFETPWHSLSDESVSSEEEPLAASPKGKGKVVSIPTKKVSPLSDNSKRTMTMSELRAARKKARSAFWSARRANKKGERALITKLGRKLTHASPLLQLIFNSDYNYLIASCQAEKTTLALQRNHPELKDVWGNLEDKITIVTPQKAEQPANLKLTLLPFQQESLFWMRKQEQGIWHGGMLAVSRSFDKNVLIDLFCLQDEMGYV